MSINNMSVYLQEECQSIYLSIFISLYKRNGVRPLTEIGLREKLLVRVKKKKNKPTLSKPLHSKLLSQFWGGRGTLQQLPTHLDHGWQVPDSHSFSDKPFQRLAKWDQG